MSTTKDCLLEKALGLFARKGYEGAGVQEIVAAAGVTKPTLYHHFGSKEGLLAALLAQRMDAFLDELAALPLSGDLEQDLRACAQRLFSFARAEPEFYRFFLALMFAPVDSPAYALACGYAHRQHKAIECLFSRTPPERNNLGVQSALLGATFQGLLHNYITLYLQGHIDLTPFRAAMAVKQFVHGIAGV
jgi:TetR/AcrR family transcriptional regulator